MSEQGKDGAEVVDLSEWAAGGEWLTGPMVCVDCRMYFITARPECAGDGQFCPNCDGRQTIVVEWEEPGTVFVYDLDGAWPREAPADDYEAEDAE